MSRRELYDLVWPEAVYKVAARYHISGVALAKTCRKHNVPLPSRGYWAQLQHGKRVHRTPLRPCKAGASETLILTEGTPRPKVAKAPLDPSIAQAISDEELESKRILMIDRVSRLHPEVKRMADMADRSRPWNERHAKISALESRRRLLLHALFRAIETRRGKVSAVTAVSFDVHLLGSIFQMSCSEKIIKRRVPLTRDELSRRSAWEQRDYKIVEERSGRLRIRTNRLGGHPHDFSDTEDTPIAARLNDLMRWLYKHSITVEERNRRAEAAWLQAIEERRKADDAEAARRTAEARRRRERERFDALIEQSSKWRHAEELRTFIAAAEATGKVESDWIDWAHGVADRLDPLSGAPPSTSQISPTQRL